MEAKEEYKGNFTKAFKNIYIIVLALASLHEKSIAKYKKKTAQGKQILADVRAEVSLATIGVSKVEIGTTSDANSE